MSRLELFFRNRMLSVLLFLLGFPVLGGYAQEAVLKGVIRDVKDKSPLIGVNVLDKGTSNGSVSNLEGEYFLKLSPGLHRIEFTYVGYDKRTEDVLLKAGEEKVFNMNMTEIQKELDIVVVTGSKYEKKLGEEVVSMEVMKQQSITQSNYRMEEALNRIPGINMVGANASIRGGSGFSSGAGSKVLALLDEMPLISPENGGIPWESLPVEAVEQIEVIKGASSALYGSAAMNGIINVRTMNPKNEPYNKLLMNYGFYAQPKDKSWSRHWRVNDTTASGKVRSRVRNRPMFGGFQFTHMKKYGDFDVVLSANYQYDMSHLQSAEKNRARAFFKLRYIPKKLSRLTVGVNGNMMYTRGKDFFIMRGLGDSAYLPFQTASLVDQRYINIDPYINYYDKHENRHSLKFRFYNAELNNGDEIFPRINPGDSSKSFMYYVDYSFYRHFKKSDIHFTAGYNGFYSTIEGKGRLSVKSTRSTLRFMRRWKNVSGSA